MNIPESGSLQVTIAALRIAYEDMDKFRLQSLSFCYFSQGVCTPHVQSIALDRYAFNILNTIFNGLYFKNSYNIPDGACDLML